MTQNNIMQQFTHRLVTHRLSTIRRLTLASCAVLSLLLAACSASPENVAGVDNPFTAEDERRFGGLTQNQLYQAARASLDKGDYSSALTFYNRLETLYPFSPLARQAQLESVFANYRAGRLESTVAQADRFIKQHPRHQDVDYAYYLRGLANFDQATENLGSLLGERDETRDPFYARSAFNSFAQLIRGYPASVYAPDSRQRMIFLKNRLAEYELHIAEYYYDRDAWVAAVNRTKAILEKYQGTPAVPDALLLQANAYRKLGLPELADNSRATLNLNYPGYNGRDRGSWLASLNPFSDDTPRMPPQPPKVPTQTTTDSNAELESLFESLEIIE